MREAFEEAVAHIAVGLRVRRAEGADGEGSESKDGARGVHPNVEWKGEKEEGRGEWVERATVQAGKPQEQSERKAAHSERCSSARAHIYPAFACASGGALNIPPTPSDSKRIAEIWAGVPPRTRTQCGIAGRAPPEAFLHDARCTDAP